MAAQAAKTQYVDVAPGKPFAYRRLGQQHHGIPLFLHIHFRANMDFWDPALVNPLAAARPVILFDQAGVGRSNGEIPITYQGWADDLIALVRALDIEMIDLFGFSMGGAAVQMVALTAPNLVRKLILAGTHPSAPSQDSDVAGIVWPREIPPKEPIKVLTSANTLAEVENALAYSFFPETQHGRIAAGEYWKRIGDRKVAEDPLLLDFVDKDRGTQNQRAASLQWSTPDVQNSFDRLGELKMPVLVMNGDNDVLIPTSRSWELAKRIPNCQLIIYPQAGHGFLYQYADVVAEHVNTFLDKGCGPSPIAKL